MMKKTKFLTENVKARLRLLKEEGNRLKRDIANGVKVSSKDVNNYKQDYIYCYNLLKECKYNYYNNKLKTGRRKDEKV